MTTSRLTMNADGSTTSSSSSVVSSNDYQPTGIEARDGFSTRHVSNHSQLHDSEIIQIDGMELKVSQARDLGLIGGPVDESLNAGSAAPRTPEVQQEDTPAQTTGHEGYDQSVAELNAKVEAGQISQVEAGEYSTALGQVALAGMTVTEVSETLDQIASGEIDPAIDLSKDQRDVVNSVESKVHRAATESVINEIGQQGFDRLAEIARGDAEFNGILRQYASMRALGRAEHTWSEFLREAEDWSRGNR
ncbi:MULTISPECIES: hypothetical protein [unclassified Aliiroseovarius]|uniref:hypothetical protein n=1 Tax=unclassified Aliiroseovarius TaxID=2623558 RepID=UPI0015682822|nr:MULTISPECIES: hypothetical protein [unclassified Aliiroseovarius]